MTPQTFHDLLEDALSQQPPSAPGRELAEGRRLLRRRRVVSAAGAAAAVAVLATGTAFALQLDAGSTLDGTRRVDPSSSSDTDLLQSCREGNQGAESTELIFGSGQPRITSVVRTSHQAILAIESAGGRYWAECFVHFDPGEFRSGMTVYDGSQRSKGHSYGFGAGCGMKENQERTCPTWVVELVDRLPQEVAAVRYDLGDGTSETRPTEDGYVVLNILHELPVGARIGPHGTLEGLDPIVQVTYLDSAGTPLAAERWDGSGGGPDGERVEGLPPLSDYPSLHGNPG